MIYVAIGVTTAVVLFLVDWWLTRPRMRPEAVRVEQCCRCNAWICDDEIHTVVEEATDDRAIIDVLVIGAGTGVSADFCGACCPGGCRNPAHAKLVA